MQDGKPRVLLVDDDFDTTDSVSALLEYDGFTVRCVTEASQANSIATDFRPDAALVDIAMPTVSGYAVIRQLRSDFPELQIVVYSGVTGKEAEGRALLSGADRFLEKPMRIEKIIGALSGSHCR